MKLRTFSGLAGAVALVGVMLMGSAAVKASAITSGDLVVIRIGDGTTAVNGSGSAITLLDYSVTYTGSVPTAVTLAQSLPVGTAVSGANQPLVQGGSAAGEGQLSRSGDGNYMSFVGYNSGPGGLTNQSPGGTETRGVGLLNLGTGAIDTTTVLTDFAAASANRGVYTTNGTDIWVASSANGIRYTTAGSATTTTALTTTANERRVNVYNGQLYTSRASGVIDGPATVGTGTPTSGSQTVTLLNGFPTATTAESAYDFFFADPNTVYVGDDRSTGTGGLQKWTYNGTIWSMVYSKLSGGTAGIKSLTGTVDLSGNVTLFGASVGTGYNKLYGWTDTLANTAVGSVTENMLLDSTTFGGTTTFNLRGVALNAPGGLVPEPTCGVAIAALALAQLRRRRRPS